MSPDSKRVLIAAIRRVAFSGLIILGAWLVLVGIRAAIPADILQGQYNYPPASWDWSRSLWTSKPVAEMIGPRVGVTTQLLVLGGLLSLVIAGVLLFLGVLISRATERPPWLAQVRQILRLVLVSGGVSTPIFMVGTLFVVYSALWWSWSQPATYEGVSWWPVFSVSLLPVWLLVQTGHGELAKWPGSPSVSYWALARHLSVRLLIRLLKLVGAIIVVTILVEQIFAGPGLGRLLMESLNRRDFPVVFGVLWVFVVMVVLVKLAAELIEIAYNHFGRPPVATEHREESALPRITIPRGWLIFCLVLVFVSIMLAIVGPAFAPFGFNEISFADRLAPPSARHILGTDNVGRDVFSRLLYGIRVNILAGLMCTGILLVVAAGWAILAAYLKKANNWLGDTLEDVVMLGRDTWCAFPWLVLLLLLMSIVGPGFIPVALMGSLMLLPRAIGMMQEAYRSPPEGRHWLYGVLWSIPVAFLFAVAGGILYTSSASYLGFGIPPPTPELGSMLSGAGRQYMLQAPWTMKWPSISLVLLLLVWVMAGDALLERLGFRSKAVWAKVVE